VSLWDASTRFSLLGVIAGKSPLRVAGNTVLIPSGIRVPIAVKLIIENCCTVYTFYVSTVTAPCDLELTLVCLRDVQHMEKEHKYYNHLTKVHIEKEH